MPRFEKGSKEAKEWAMKMREARGSKKGAPSKTHPGDMDYTTKKGDIVFHEKGHYVKKGRKPYVKGGWLQPGEIPLSSTSEAMIAEKEQQAPVELSAEEFITEDDIAGSGMCRCHKCKMCGGAIMSNPENQYVPMLQAQLQKSRFNSGEVMGGKVNIGKAFKKAGKTLSKGMDKATAGFAKVGEVLNPMTYALGNKTTRDAMIASGEFTHDYALPAVVSAGLPVYYGTAGAAGAMLGGPLGAMAATKGADMLWQNMVAKPGYDPRQNQKSKTLGVVSTELGKLGASQLKAGMSGKTKAVPPKNGGVAQAGKGLRKKKKKIIIIE